MSLLSVLVKVTCFESNVAYPRGKRSNDMNKMSKNVTE